MGLQQMTANSVKKYDHNRQNTLNPAVQIFEDYIKTWRYTARFNAERILTSFRSETSAISTDGNTYRMYISRGYKI